jgi:hypothetical protein
VSLTLRYVDFWPGFNPESFLFTELIRKFIDPNVEIVEDTSTLVDLQFHSVFCFSSRNQKLFLKLKSVVHEKSREDYLSRLLQAHRIEGRYPSREKIWYTGENRRPPLNHFSATISFEPTDKITNNLYFPYWMTRLDWGFSQNQYEIMPKIENLMSTRQVKNKSLEACVFSSGIDLIRERIIEATERSLRVDKFGARYSQRVPSKLEVSEQYLFQICSENDIYPGYVTEKLPEAWSAGNIPIWAGLQSIPYFNNEAFLDFTNLDFESIMNILNSMNLEKINDMQAKPILILEPSIDPLVELISMVVG